MINTKSYIPIIKTGDAEIKALCNIGMNVKNFILPLFELTRGRRSKKEEDGNITKKIEFLSEKFKETPFILDITSSQDLSNTELDQLRSSNESYKKWTEFCISHKNDFGVFYPVIQIEEEEEYGLYIEKLWQQILELNKNFDYIVFRSQDVIEARDLITDIKTILDRDDKSLDLKNKIIYVLDYKYIINSDQNVDSAVTFIKALSSIGINKIILASTSFPSNISEHMNANNYISFKIKEFDFYKNILKLTENLNIKLIYGDYASINPTRNDNVFARGWIPRIDVPSIDKQIHCLRKKRSENNTYANTYALVAREVIQKKYFRDLDSYNICSWGQNIIQNAAVGNVEGSAPRFWISVRMNIYLNLLTEKLSEFISI